MRATCPSWPLLNEVGLLPVQLEIFQRCVGLYNGMLSLGEDSVYRRVMQQNLLDAQLSMQSSARRHTSSCWGSYLLRGLMAVDRGVDWLNKLLAGEVIPWPQLQCTLIVAYQKAAEYEHMTIRANGELVHKQHHRYFTLMAQSISFQEMPKVFWSEVKFSVAADFMRFRLGCHGLAVDEGRRLQIPYHQRICKRCACGCVDDEKHFLFDCSWQPLLDLRQKYASMLSGISSLSRFMRDATSQRMAYVSACMKALRLHVLSVDVATN